MNIEKTKQKCHTISEIHVNSIITTTTTTTTTTTKPFSPKQVGVG
jgi:hypothetical protein